MNKPTSTAADWIAAARAVNATINIVYYNGRRYLNYPVSWEGLPDPPIELGKEIADLLEAEARS